jgi:large subunit ribosomal protein L5
MAENEQKEKKPKTQKSKAEMPQTEELKAETPKTEKSKTEKPKTEKSKGAKKAPETSGRPLRTPQSRLFKLYREEIVPAMMRQFGWSNMHQVPRVRKVIVSMGVGDASRDIKLLEAAQKDLTIIAGQKPMMARARVSVASYKIRTGMPIGAFVTLRGNRMYEFLDRLFNLALPRVRDFQGLNPNSFDGTGNFTFGIREQLVFPEIDYDEIDRVRGMDITIVTSAENDMHALALLKGFGCPFRSIGPDASGESEG